MFLKLKNLYVNFGNVTNYYPETGLVHFVGDNVNALELTEEQNILARWFLEQLTLSGPQNVIFDVGAIYGKRDEIGRRRTEGAAAAGSIQEIEDKLEQAAVEFEKIYGKRPNKEQLEKARALVVEKKLNFLPIEQRKN